MISVSCPHCGKSGRAPDSAAGKTLRCSICRKTFRVSENLDQAEDADEAPAPRRVLLLALAGGGVVLVAVGGLVLALMFGRGTPRPLDRVPAPLPVVASPPQPDERDQKIKALEIDLAAARSELAAAQAKIAELQKPKTPTPPAAVPVKRKTVDVGTLYPFKMEVGQVGVLYDGSSDNGTTRYKVDRVIDANTLLIGQYFIPFARGRPVGAERRIQSFFVHGIDASNHVSNRQINLPQRFEVVGTKTNGADTFLLLEPAG